MDINVRVVMTKNAMEFITPLTFQTLSQNPVAIEMFKSPERWEIEHISLARAADVMVIAPATANIIGKIASGIADDLLTTTIMATKAPVIIAPAMNANMYENEAVQDNIKKLKKRGYIFVEPAVGRLACGINAKGKLASVGHILEIIENHLTKKDMQSQRVLVTAGPTIEKIDAVRYISNYSSGKMGYALAKAARNRGAKVTLVSGRVSLSPPVGVEFIQVTSAADMYKAVTEIAKEQDIIIKAAAVSDFTPSDTYEHKLKKDKMPELKLTKNPDILMELGKEKNYFLVGFCMETENLIQNAIEKLNKKNLDMIVANSLNEKGAGFGTDTNIATIITPQKQESLPLMSKYELAHKILDKVMECKQ
jgi:phosphopantothenoylcysteine decarboxylase/phosphopantothenate--cysteine ligase